MIAGITFMRFEEAHREHLRQALDTVRERFGVRLGPLHHVVGGKGGEKREGRAVEVRAG